MRSERVGRVQDGKGMEFAGSGRGVRENQEGCDKIRKRGNARLGL